MNVSERLEKNNKYYQKHINAVGSRSDSRDFTKGLDLFCELVRSGVVVDVGCGTGNHLAVFKDRNISAIGVEPCDEMIELVKSKDLDCIKGSFEEFPNLEDLGGVWAASSLLHVPKEEVLNVFKSLNSLLKKGAPFYFTVRLGDKAKWDKFDDEDDQASRFIQLFEEEFLDGCLLESGFKIVEKWIEQSYWGRPAQWISFVALKG